MITEVGKLEFVDKDLYKILDDLGEARPKVELDLTDHIYFKCKKCGHELVITHIEAESWEDSDRQYITVIRFYFLCPECGTPYYMKAYQPMAFGHPDIKKNTKKLFIQGVRKGWINKTWKEIMDYVHSAKYSKSVLDYVGLTKKKFKLFEKWWDKCLRPSTSRQMER